LDFVYIYIDYDILWPELLFYYVVVGEIVNYPKVHAVGHSAIPNLFDGDVYVEEKIDGSQFSFGVFGDELQCFSKSKQLDIHAPEGMFVEAVEYVKQIEHLLAQESLYTCEYLRVPKHNVLHYSRCPRNYLMLLDIGYGYKFVSQNMKKFEAEWIGIECVPLYYHGKILGLKDLRKLLDNISVLGGTLIEGVVVKNYNFSPPLFGKYKSDKYTEVARNWKLKPGDSVLKKLAEQYGTQARWEKALQHLQERGEIVGGPADIHQLNKEVMADVKEECEDEIKEFLFTHYWKELKHELARGLPNWYMEYLAEKAFE